MKDDFLFILLDAKDKELIQQKAEQENLSLNSFCLNILINSIKKQESVS